MTSVVHVITGLGGGGAEGFLARLLPELSGRDVQSTVVSLTDDGVHGERLRRQGVDVLPLGISPARPDPRALLRLRAHLGDLHPDVVMTWLPDADLVGGLVARSLRLPVVWNVRQSGLGPEAPRRHRTVVGLQARLARHVPSRIVCVSRRARDDHVRLGFPAERCVVVHNGFDLVRLRPDGAARPVVRAELGLPAGAPVVGHAARLDPQKDHRTLLEALALVARERPEARFVLCGSGVEPAAPLLAGARTDPDLAGRVLLLGQRPDLPRLLPAWDVAVSSSAYGEGLTNALGEAMACGVPCVATDVGDARELLGPTGVVVRPRDPRALAAAVLEVLSGPRPPLDAPRRRIEQHFSLAAAADAYATVMSQVARGER